MNLQEALQIMKIDNGFSHLSLDTLKKKYHKLALIHHPDKNGNSIEAKEKFQKLGFPWICEFERLTYCIFILNSKNHGRSYI